MIVSRGLEKSVVRGAGVLLACAIAGPAAAQGVIGMGTAQQGATVYFGTQIAKVVSQRSGLQMRTQALASTGQYAARINAGELEFGLSNVIEATFAHQGKEIFEGRPNPNVRLALTLFPLPVTYFVTEKSGIRSPQQLAGAKTPTGWNTQRLGEYIFRGFFANVNRPYESVRGVPVTAMPRMWDLFGQGELDFAFGVLNGALTKELEVKVGGVKYLSVDDSAAAIERMQRWLPGSYVTSDTNLANGETVKNIAFDFVVFTSTKISDDVVYKVVKAVYESRDELKNYAKKGSPKMAAKAKLEYHPGAIRFYREVGAWPPKD